MKMIFNSASMYYFDSSEFPSSVNLSITSKCNNRCVMCYDENFINQPTADMSFETIEKVLREISKYKSLLFLTGGEPFCRTDVFDILTLAKKLKIPTGICTNGTLFNEEKLIKLSRMNLDNIVFSLHGPKEIHNAITCNNSSYQKLVKSIRIFNEYNKNTTTMVNCAITNDNYKSINTVIKIVKKLPIDYIRFQNLSYITSDELSRYKKESQRFFGQVIPIHQFVTDENFSQIGKSMQGIKFKGKVILNPNIKRKHYPQWYIQPFTVAGKCVMTSISTFINHQGNIFPCQNYSYKLGNVNKTTIYKAFNSKKSRHFKNHVKKKLLHGCHRCCKL